MTTSFASRQPGGPRSSADRAIRAILVEDDSDLRQGLAEYLRLSGIVVTDVPSGIAFYKALRADSFDIAILDVNLPDTTGFELARDLSAQKGGMGVIMLTARAGRTDRIQGYAEGADLYLTKPVDGEELLLAARNLARRVREASASAGEEAALPAAAPAWRLDRQGHRLVSPEAVALQLSGRELMLLECLAAAGGETVARSTLVRHLGYAEMGSESRSLDAVLRRLRQKALEGGVDLPLRVIHAVGFRFAAPIVMS